MAATGGDLPTCRMRAAYDLTAIACKGYAVARCKLGAKMASTGSNLPNFPAARAVAGRNVIMALLRFVTESRIFIFRGFPHGNWKFYRLF